MIEWRNRRKWRSDLSRSGAYIEVAAKAAAAGLAAQRGGFREDSKILAGLAENLLLIARSPDGKSALRMMRSIT